MTPEVTAVIIIFGGAAILGGTITLFVEGWVAHPRERYALHLARKAKKRRRIIEETIDITITMSK